MKKLNDLKYLYMLFLTVQLFSVKSFSDTLKNTTPYVFDNIHIDYLLEYGEELKLKSKTHKMWIEQPSLISATTKNDFFYIKPLQMGISVILIDQKKLRVMVIPEGFKSSIHFWQKYLKNIFYLKLSLCEQTICIKGTLLNWNQFESLQNQMTKSNHSIFLKLNTDQITEDQIKKYYASYFKALDFSPALINLKSTPWKISLNLKDDSIQNRMKAYQVGLFTTENKRKIDINENIKVSVKILEIKKNLLRELGFAWDPQIQAQSQQNSTFIDSQIFVKLIGSENNSNTHILAEPTLICSHGKEAEFLAGGEIPIKTSSKQGHQVIWKSYGISLKIKPLVDSLGQMSLDISTELSTPNFDRSVDGIPTIQSHKVSSHFDLAQSKTIMISGLVQSDNSSFESGLPYLKQIPILGHLFKSQGFLNHQTELVIFVTPEVFQ